MMWVHMAPLMRGSVRPWGVSSSRSGEGSSVAKAAYTHRETSLRPYRHLHESASHIVFRILQANTAKVGKKGGGKGLGKRWPLTPMLQSLLEAQAEANYQHITASLQKPKITV